MPGQSIFRACRPLTLLARFAPRQRERPMNELIAKETRLTDETAVAWSDAVDQWDIFKRHRARVTEDETGTTLTRERWILEKPGDGSKGCNEQGRGHNARPIPRAQFSGRRLWPVQPAKSNLTALRGFDTLRVFLRVFAH
jgi:hypothetical protein